MAIVNGSKALAGNSTDLVEFDGGVRPGIRADDANVLSGPLTFSLGAMGASLYAGTALGLTVTGGSLSDANRVREVLGNLIRELIRTGVVKGTYSA